MQKFPAPIQIIHNDLFVVLGLVILVAETTTGCGRGAPVGELALAAPAAAAGVPVPAIGQHHRSCTLIRTHQLFIWASIKLFRHLPHFPSQR